MYDIKLCDICNHVSTHRNEHVHIIESTTRTRGKLSFRSAERHHRISPLTYALIEQHYLISCRKLSLHNAMQKVKAHTAHAFEPQSMRVHMLCPMPNADVRTNRANYHRMLIECVCTHLLCA